MLTEEVKEVENIKSGNLKKKLHVITYGCQMNVYDSEKMAELMKPFGFEITDDLSESDMVIMNTCHIREKASEKVYSELGKINIIKQRRKANAEDMLIVVAGCVSQAEGDQIFKRAPFVDIVTGPQSYHTLPELVRKAREDGKFSKQLDLEFRDIDKFDNLPQASGIKNGSAFLTIQEGCDKFCHFCCVPYTRGAEYSRAIEDIIREAMGLISIGAVELNLLGQNVNAFHGIDFEGKEWNLGKLLYQMAKLPGLKRLRYTTSHPNDMHEELFDAHRDIEILMPYLHLPVQSGSDRILKAMNRKHNRDTYFRIIDRLREMNPRMAFSSDFIVGYPGETDKDFEDTLDLVRRVKYAQCFSFKYSIRPGTVAAVYDNQVPEEVKQERLLVLQELLKEQQGEFNRSVIGKRMSVLFDDNSKHEEYYHGKTEYMQSVLVPRNQFKKYSGGMITEVEITSATIHNLRGNLVND